jgi:predicted cupin superfamily sugar epimerase
VLGLAAHPEGGWFREVFRSPERIGREGLPARFPGARALATSILYLLGAGECSRFHRLRADELWCHHGGWRRAPPPARARRSPQARGRRRHAAGHRAHGTWFAAEPEPGAAFALAGCFVSPGFEFEDFELGNRDQLLAGFPGERDLVMRFTHGDER